MTPRDRIRQQIEGLAGLRAAVALDAVLATHGPEHAALRSRLAARAAIWRAAALALTPLEARRGLGPESELRDLAARPAVLAVADTLGRAPHELAADSPLEQIVQALWRCTSSAQVDGVLDRVRVPPPERPWAGRTLDAPGAEAAVREAVTGVGRTILTGTLQARAHLLWAEAVERGEGTPEMRRALQREAAVAIAAAGDLIVERVAAGQPVTPTQIADRLALERLLQGLPTPPDGEARARPRGGARP